VEHTVVGSQPRFINWPENVQRAKTGLFCLSISERNKSFMGLALGAAGL